MDLVSNIMAKLTGDPEEQNRCKGILKEVFEAFIQAGAEGVKNRLIKKAESIEGEFHATLEKFRQKL